jgi:hypothetical protein
MPITTRPIVKSLSIAAGLLALTVVLFSLAAGTLPALAPNLRFGNHATVKATLYVGRQRPLLIMDRDRQETPEEWEAYRKSAQDLIKNRYVLAHVLAKPSVAKLPMIKELQNSGHDPEGWLENHLSASFHEGSEILEVSLGGDRPEDLARVVNEVIRSYIELIVDEEEKEKARRLEKLETLWQGYQKELKTKRQAIKALAEASEGSWREDRGRAYVEALGRELDQLRVARLKADAELAVRKARKGGREGEAASVAALEESLTVMAKQIDSLQAASRQPREGLYLSGQQQEIRITEEWAGVVRVEIERVKSELGAPGRVRMLASAKPSPGSN